jgi:hypothetical protein
MAQIRWSLTASEDLQELEDFIARDSVLHAIQFVVLRPGNKSQNSDSTPLTFIFSPAGERVCEGLGLGRTNCSRQSPDTTRDCI